MSPLESYSILEKINEWKKDEGIISSQESTHPCNIPRPSKLIMEIDEDDITQIKQQLS